MKNDRTRLFVIADPTASHQIALVKALLIAKLADCHIYAFLCIHENVQAAKTGDSRKDFKRHKLAEAENWLQEQLQPCRVSDIPYTTEIVWNSRWIDSALRAVTKSGCELLIKSSFHHSKAKRFFNKTSDYSLMRNCACPILFTHQVQEWKSDSIVACIDLETDDRQHTRLNNVIVRDARAFADRVGMDLYLACAYLEQLDGRNLPIASRGRTVTAEQVGKLYGVDPKRVLLRQGATIETLRTICDEVNPSILVIGSIARTGIKGRLIGNTAEKLLDLVDADLLTVN